MCVIKKAPPSCIKKYFYYKTKSKLQRVLRQDKEVVKVSKRYIYIFIAINNRIIPRRFVIRSLVSCEGLFFVSKLDLSFTPFLSSLTAQ